MIHKIDIIITTKNRLADLVFTINHMIAIGFNQNQFFIIDDGSTDGTYESLQKQFPDCKLKRNDVSKGYMLNRSEMMESTNREYILSLDDDSHIRTREDIEEALRLMDSSFDYGIFHFCVFNQLEAPPEKEKLKNTFRLLRGYIGCGHLIKREVIQKVGRYREELVFYCEELDYALRAFKLGYKTISQDNLVVHHRIDMNARAKQKNTVNSKGIYGREWRNIHLYSNNMIVTGLYYPIGVDWFFILYRAWKAFVNMVLKEKQFVAYFKMLARFCSFIPYMFSKSNKLSYKSFFEWFGYPDMTDGSGTITSIV